LNTWVPERARRTTENRKEAGMIAKIKKPHFEMRGDIPPDFLELTKKHFGSKAVH
jgi:hypothetical protein